MEELQKLEEALKEVNRGMKRLELSAGQYESRIEQGEKKIKSLEGEISILEEKRNRVDQSVRDERKAEILQIESKLSEANKVLGDAENERRNLVEQQARLSQREMEVKGLKEELEARLTEVGKKEVVISEKLKQIEAFQNTLR